VLGNEAKVIWRQHPLYVMFCGLKRYKIIIVWYGKWCKYKAKEGAMGMLRHHYHLTLLEYRVNTIMVTCKNIVQVLWWHSTKKEYYQQEAATNLFDTTCDIHYPQSDAQYSCLSVALP
jgi:hypothetical protein